MGLPAQRGTVPTDGKGAQLTVNRLELILILLTEMVYRASSHRVRQAQPVHAGQISTVLVAIFLARATAEGRVANDRAAARLDREVQSRSSGDTARQAIGPYRRS